MSSTTPQRFPLIAGGILGATGVALGALGTHRLQPILDERGMAHAWDTGARYHMFHALAVLALAALVAVLPAAAQRLLWAARWLTLGTVLFSGSLYWFALGGPHPLVYVTPLGGLSLLLGWGFVIVAGFQRAR